MKLATLRHGGATRSARIESDHAVLLPFDDVGQLLQLSDWRVAGAGPGPEVGFDDVTYAPLVPRPDKIVCVGLNYRAHILEMGNSLPEYPTLFAKYRGALIGAHDDIVLPAVSDTVDWEAELAVIIGAPGRHLDATEADAVIAGYSIINDVSARDWQRRTTQFLQGKTFESSTPLGPWLVTADEHGARPGAEQSIVCEIDGVRKQQSVTGDLVFGVPELVSYVSRVITLLPGDVIATGTPGGVGAGRTPPEFLHEGSIVVTRIDGLGELRNRCVRERIIRMP